jgi:excisionase family DNA binding protein
MTNARDCGLAWHLSVVEAEEHTGVSRWTWRRMAYDGRVASVKLGTRLLIPLAEIERVLQEGARPRLHDVRHQTCGSI